MLGSADPEPNNSSDKSAAKKLMIAMNAKGAKLPMANFIWTKRVCYWLLLFYSVLMKNQLTSMRYCHFSMILGMVHIDVNQAKDI